MRAMTSALWIIFRISLVVGNDVFNTLPPSVMKSFSCRGRNTGFYADIDSNCQIYHACDDYGNKFTYHCPQNTAFCQETLVCDHAYLVDCKKSAALIAKISEDLKNDFNINPTYSKANPQLNSYSRSYHISIQPSVLLLAPKQSDEDTTTFVMSSTVFLRDQSHSQINNQTIKNNQNISDNKVMQQNHLSTTPRSRLINHKSAVMPTNASSHRTSKNSFFEKNTANSNNMNNNGVKFNRSMTTARHNNNYPYTETLRSIQNKFFERRVTTTAKTTTAGTEFPIPILVGTLANFQNPDDDPYYPPQRMNTERYYTVINKNKPSKSFESYTQHSQQKKLDLKIPEVLPDFNSLEDLVDRRIHLYIKKTNKNNKL